MKQFLVDGHELKYREFGDGTKTLVLIHGFGGNPTDWNPIVEILEKHYRIIAIGIKTFFSSPMPLTFSSQIGIIKDFIIELKRRGEISNSIAVAGQSYGGMLALGLSLSDLPGLEQVFLINPMPFSPLEIIKNKHLKIVLQISSAPGGVQKILRSPKAIEAIEAIGNLFHLGIAGEGEIRHFNHRKLLLVEKAIERFLWIDQHEDWRGWLQLLENRNENTDLHILYATKDVLFTIDDFLELANITKADSRVPIPFEGHLLAQHKPKEVSKFILKTYKDL